MSASDFERWLCGGGDASKLNPDDKTTKAKIINKFSRWILMGNPGPILDSRSPAEGITQPQFFEKS
jgi:hypothetical protein